MTRGLPRAGGWGGLCVQRVALPPAVSSRRMGVAVGPGSCPCPSVRIREDRARQHRPSTGELGLGVRGRGGAKSIRAGPGLFPCSAGGKLLCKQVVRAGAGGSQLSSLRVLTLSATGVVRNLGRVF